MTRVSLQEMQVVAWPKQVTPSLSRVVLLRKTICIGGSEDGEPNVAVHVIIRYTAIQSDRERTPSRDVRCE